MDFSGTIKRTVGAGLEQEAFRQFGAVAEEFTRSTLGGIFGATGAAPDPTKTDAELTDINRAGTWSETYYAAALARGGDFRPRLKFLFKVSFMFAPEVLEFLSSLFGKPAEEIQRNLTFLVKAVDKPKFDFDYQEVNLYNFRTKVLRRISHRELNLAFFDDSGNAALTFFEMYRRALQPAARLPHDGVRTALDDYGFAFQSGRDTALRGALPNNGIHPLARIIVHQIYLDHGVTGKSNPQNSVMNNNFVFVNPRIVSFDLEDLDFEQGGSHGIAIMTFDFDLLYVDIGADVMAGPFSGHEPQLQTGDILYGATRTGTGEISARGSPNPFVDVIARQGQRAVQETISGALNKKFGNTVAGRALGGAFYQAGGILAEAAGRTLSSVGIGISNAISPPKPPPAVDNSVGGQVVGQVPSDPTTGA